ncbi:protein kinase superfamily protein [Abortiporus biennis]
MSAPPSPTLLRPDHDKGRAKRRDKPPALEFTDPKAASDGDLAYVRDRAADVQQPRLHVSHADNHRHESGSDLPRSPSATSSLDPYYFGVHTPSESPPVPPLPSTGLLPRTPDLALTNDPITPNKDPALIDRRGLVGVGELATPRWTRNERRHEVDVEDPVDEVQEDEGWVDTGVDIDREKDMPDSPWTIEAVDGEQEPDDTVQLEPLEPPRALRSSRSMADESGGEEILYPRHPLPVASTPQSPVVPQDAHSTDSSPGVPSSQSEANPPVSPPSSFITPTHRARKRTSEEFELDNTGLLVSKHASPTSSVGSKEKDKSASVRKHRSLGVGLPSSATPKERPKDRRRDTLSVNVKHSRQTSGSSSSSSHGEPRHRVHTSDFLNLPPSPSSSSIQQFLRHGNTGSATGLNAHGSPRDSQQHASHVAHSLLRGTQEGWSDLDDQATAEALRKLDGLTGRSARARSSIGGHSRVGSTSRPTTPVKSGSSSHGGDSHRSSRRMSAHSSLSGKDKDKFKEHRGTLEAASEEQSNIETSNGEAHSSSPSLEKSTKKIARSSFTPKRSSASSTTYTSTPTTSSRDSASLSNATSATSVSAISSRQSNPKVRRNSAGSDVSNFSGDVAQRDRVASTGEHLEDHIVPPVPPLPKDIPNYKSAAPQPTVVSMFSSSESEDRDKPMKSDVDSDRKPSLEVPPYPHTPSKRASIAARKATSPTTTSVTHKTPSKKWSFSNALGKLSKSPSTSSMNDSSSPRSPAIVSPRSLTFGQQLRKSNSKDRTISSPKTSMEEWATVNTDAMASASSLASLSSIGSVHPMSPPASAPPPITHSKTPDRMVVSRPDTASSTNTNLTAAPPIPNSAPLSPSSSIRRGPSTKRLTPSSIPFFRRSSSQSMQIPTTTLPSSISPTNSTSTNSTAHLRAPNNVSPTKDGNLSTASSIPGSTHKKSSVLSLGLPSLLKGSSSRRSLHSDKEKGDAKSPSQAKSSDKEKSKKDEKDRSESRISVLMGRKRGKTLSSAQPKKPEPAVAMPPMQMTALPPATAQRLANLKSASNSSLSSTSSTPKSSRVTAQTVSSMQKHSDSSLRSRNQLPTIAGSPSVGSITHHSTREPPPSSSLNASSGLSKETPTKIPRISSRSSAANSPTLKSNASRRTSVLIGSTAPTSRGPSPGVANESINEFGVLDNGQTPKNVASTAQRHVARNTSPSVSTSRVPRQVSAPSSTVNGTSRKNRESLSFSGLRKSSTGSIASIQATVAPETQSHHHRFSALSPSKGLKLLSPKVSLSAARTANSASTSQSMAQVLASPSGSRQSLSTPSPAPSSVDEEEVIGDEEMMQYIRRQQAKKLAAGVSQQELDEMLRFPEPLPPVPGMSPNAVLRSNQAQYLSEYERCKEILDYQAVYYIGAHSQKNPATLNNDTNNWGYDDDRGDYLVINHDHLAYRYEIIDTLGKGSFGQVLHCRDHCTGESVAIKIIRNKKRFHHQALVEIKILESLKKWDQEEKHHVIKMNEHFYFRNHLCIAMELLSINLYELIKANGFVGFTTGLIRRFTSQMLQSLALMRHHRIVHCDLKPENVLLKHPAKSAIKVIDFGSSCFEHEKIYTYIQSRFYRSPEVILGMNYHMAIDMWSLGCILAELYTGFPIFPGENEQEQLSCIMEVLGVPEKDFINRSSRKRLFFDTTGAPRPVVNSKGRRRRAGSKSLQQVLRCDDEMFVDFISKCLVWDPERRLKPQAALRHPFVTAGKRTKVTSPSPSTAKTLLSSTTSTFTGRSKGVTETPKKSLISAPTPLTARTSRVSTAGVVPTTPSNSNSIHATLGSSRSYRTSQAQSVSYHSSRSMPTK